jgi:hypothetical protein
VGVRVIEGSARRGQDWELEGEEEGDPLAFAFINVAQTQSFIEIPLVNDAAAESTETLTLEVNEVFGATLTGPSTVTGTIRDDDSS